MLSSVASLFLCVFSELIRIGKEIEIVLGANNCRKTIHWCAKFLFRQREHKCFLFHSHPCFSAGTRREILLQVSYRPENRQHISYHGRCLLMLATEEKIPRRVSGVLRV